MAEIEEQRKEVLAKRFGPFRTSPDVKTPKHAYSPWNEEKVEYKFPPGGDKFVPGRVLIKIGPKVQVTQLERQGAWTSERELNKLLQDMGIISLQPVFRKANTPQRKQFLPYTSELQTPPDLTRWYKAALSEKEDVKLIAKKLSASPYLQAAEPDYLRKLAPEGPVRILTDDSRSGDHSNVAATRRVATGEDHPLTSDPRFGEQWHLGAIRASEAWLFLASNGFTAGGSRDVVVAVIDTGVDYNHPDLAINMWTNPAELAGQPGVDNDGNGFIDDIYGANVVGTHSGNPMDDHGHGTHVAGIIAAQANNNIGGVGVAYNVKIMGIKAAQYSGVLSTTDIAEAVIYSVNKGADVINMSFGGYAKSQVEEDALMIAFGQAVLVAAAGNDGKVTKPCPLGANFYPAAYNWVLGVIASNQAGSRAGFSNFDCTPRDIQEYELMAPGVDILSTLPNNQYAAWDGTSMAAPVVSGIAALLRSHPLFSNKDVYSSRFIMGQIAANGDDAYKALTVYPKPELSYLQHWLFDTMAQSPGNDADGIVDAGETIDLAVVIRNHWGKADNVEVNLRAYAQGAFQDDPYVTFATSTVNYGAIGSFNWDDNGLIYNSQGVITGVSNPFSFTVSSAAYNDHVIPFIITMTAKNGLDPADTATYAFQSRFNLIVQRGRELPRIISQSMTLTKDDFWIVPGQTLIESGATVTITAGTQVQWGTPKPSDPYSQPTTPAIQVEGKLLGQGTYDEPVELFNSPIIGINTYIYNSSNGITNITYTKIRNPWVGVDKNANRKTINSVDHVFIDWNNSAWVFNSNSLTNSVLYKLRQPTWAYENLFNPGIVNNSLLNYVWVYNTLSTMANWGIFPKNSVFIPDNENNRGFIWTLRGIGGSTFISTDINNAFLNKYWDLDINNWLRFSTSSPRDTYHFIASNYWATNSTALIDAAIYDYNDNVNIGNIAYQPILITPAETTYPFVVDVILSTSMATNIKVVGAETVAFTVTFNRDMDLTVQPSVSFGPDVPYTDYTAHPISGGWQNARTWKGNFNVTPITGDGYQLMRIAGPARAASDPWLVIGDDAARFRFEIITSGTEAMVLQATGKEGRVELSWMQDDFDMLAGYNLYRSTTQGGNYARLNPNIIPPFQKTYIDSNVQPGQPYYYKFTVVKTDMSESAFSNISSGTPLDTIPPVIVHTPVTGAPLGLPIQIYADVTDNVGVTAVTLYYRPIGTGAYTSASMVNTSGNRWSTNIPGSSVTAPGLHYYLTAEDGVNITYHGNAGNPHQITVVDQPQVTNISPNRGPAAGGTAVAIAGTNFKAGASLKFGDTLATNTVVVSSTNITATTPAHYPAVVDVIVTNPDGKQGSLLQAFTYEGIGTVVSLPNTSGDINGIVEIPLSISNVEGLLAAYTVITFNSSVLSAQSARTGNMASGWTLAANTGTPGRVNLSLAGATTSSGSGNLAHITFRVVGNSLATTALTLDTVRLNDGAITATLSHGYFTVNDLFDVSGRVTYYQGGAGLASVTMNMIGSQPYATVANSLGYFNIMGMANGPYTLTPAKSDQANGITSYDASLALQAEVGLISLSSNQQKAADVNKNGIVSAMDASYILQKSAGLIDVPFPGAGKVWDFVPPERTYQPLNSDRSSQDFAAILIGDISGNWSGAGGQGMVRIRAETTGSATLTLAQAKALPQGQVTVPLNLSLTQGSLYGADIVIGYDASVATAPIVNKGSLAGGFSMAANLNQPGQIKIAMAGAMPITGSGELLNIGFKVIGPSGTISPLQIMSADLNEGAISTQLQNGSIVINLLASVNMPPGWNMFSYPFLPDPPTIIGQLGDDMAAGFYVYHYNPEGGIYITTNEATAGWGYWVKVSANTLVDGTGFPAGKTTDFELPLGQGWNQIGNPFNANVSWGNVKVRYSGQVKNISEAYSSGWVNMWLYSYNTISGTYDVWDVSNGILKPFTGYWVKANVSGAALLIPPPP